MIYGKPQYSELWSCCSSAELKVAQIKRDTGKWLHMHATDISFSKGCYLYMHVYYTNIKSDSYSQFGVDAGVGSLKLGVA